MAALAAMLGAGCATIGCPPTDSSRECMSAPARYDLEMREQREARALERSRAEAERQAYLRWRAEHPVEARLDDIERNTRPRGRHCTTSIHLGQAFTNCY
jgi:hypothetical protein